MYICLVVQKMRVKCHRLAIKEITRYISHFFFFKKMAKLIILLSVVLPSALNGYYLPKFLLCCYYKEYTGRSDFLPPRRYWALAE